MGYGFQGQGHRADFSGTLTVEANGTSLQSGMPYLFVGAAGFAGAVTIGPGGGAATAAAFACIASVGCAVAVGAITVGAVACTASERCRRAVGGLLQSSTSAGANSEGSGQRTVDDLIGESTAGRETKGRADQYIHGGGREQRDKDFDSLGATDVKDRGNGTRTGTLPDGRPVNVHDSKTDGVPTIQIGNGSREIKSRYP